MRNDLERARWGSPANADPSERPLDRRTEFSLAEAWAEETVREAQTSRRVAWIATFVLIVICAAQAAAIAVMLPLKQIEPYTILVDKTTGYLEMVRGVKPGNLPQDQAVVESFLAQYVLARETFDAADLTERYNRVALWSDGEARADYVAAYQTGGALAGINPASRVSVTVKRVEILSRNLARVRFSTARRDAAGAPSVAPSVADWQATIGFRFSGAPMRMEDRLINPLGFQAVSYRRDAEAPLLAPEQPVPGPGAVQNPPPQDGKP